MKLWIFTHRLNNCDRRKDNNSLLDESDKSIIFIKLTYRKMKSKQGVLVTHLDLDIYIYIFTYLHI